MLVMGGGISQFIHKCEGGAEFVEGKMLRDHFQTSKVFYLGGICDSDRSCESFKKGKREPGLLLPKGKLRVN